MMAQVCADLGEEGIELVFSPFGLKCGNQWLGMVELRETIALVGIEHRIGLEHTAALGA